MSESRGMFGYEEEWEGYQNSFGQECPWTIEEECGCGDHEYHSDDAEGGRCYCGIERYPAGGPR